MSDSFASLIGFFHPWDFLGKNTGVCCHFFLQGNLTQGSNPCLLHCRWILYHWATREALMVLLISFKRLVFICWLSILCFSPFFILIFGFFVPPSSMWDHSSPTKDRTHASCIESILLTTGPPGKSHFLFLTFYSVNLVSKLSPYFHSS